MHVRGQPAWAVGGGWHRVRRAQLRVQLQPPLAGASFSLPSPANCARADQQQNFGIICAFGVAFISAYWTLTEFNTRTSGERTVTWFKRGARVAALHEPAAGDEESASAPSTAAAYPSDRKRESSIMTEKRAEGADADAEKTQMRAEPAHAAPAMTDVFSWQHLEYTVTMPDGSERRLLDDVSGFVAPGKLTALMGESGAGKVRLCSQYEGGGELMGGADDAVEYACGAHDGGRCAGR